VRGSDELTSGHRCMHCEVNNYLCASPNAMSACWYLPASSWGALSSLLLLVVSELLSEHNCWRRLFLPMIVQTLHVSTTAQCQQGNRYNILTRAPDACSWAMTSGVLWSQLSQPCGWCVNVYSRTECIPLSFGSVGIASFPVLSALL
jgi:hypothetical protein